MELPNSKPFFNTYNSGIKNFGFYSRSHPYGGGLYYDINHDWTVYGGISKIGKGFTDIKSYGPEVGVSYHPSCKIF